jgi:uncharacterized damage-inducible protein DinB
MNCPQVNQELARSISIWWGWVDSVVIGEQSLWLEEGTFMEIQDMDAFLDYLDKVHKRTMRVVRCIPAEKLDWSFRGGKFTLGELVRHMAAIERYMFAETIQGNPSRYAGCGKELASDYEETVAFIEKAHQESVEIFSKLGPEALTSKCRTPDGASITVWKWLRSMVEHEIHHRGQIYTYLAILGVDTPPLYGLTSEQVRDRSVA